MALMGPDVAFCLSCAEVRDDATQQPLSYLFTSLGPTGVYSVSKFMSHQIKGLVSPGATLIRRKDILNHLLVGRDVQEATVNAINLFDLAKMNYQARLLGEPRPIRDDDLAVFRSMRFKTPSTPENPGKPGDMVYSLWRFYSRQLDDRQR